MEYNRMGNPPNMGGENVRPFYAAKRRNGCLEEGLKVGCGFILGVVSTVMFLSFSYFASVSNYSDEESEKKALYGVSKEEFQYYNVKSKKRKATIHTIVSRAVTCHYSIISLTILDQRIYTK